MPRSGNVKAAYRRFKRSKHNKVTKCLSTSTLTNGNIPYKNEQTRHILQNCCSTKVSTFDQLRVYQLKGGARPKSKKSKPTLTYKNEKKRKHQKVLSKNKCARKNYRFHKRNSQTSNVRLHRQFMNRALYSIDNFDERKFKTFLTEKLTYCKNCYAYLFVCEKRFYPSLCCECGNVKTEKIRIPYEPIKSWLHGTTTEAKVFRSNVQRINAMFSYASTGFGQKFQAHSLPGNKPYWQPNYICQGQVNHLIGS